MVNILPLILFLFCTSSILASEPDLLELQASFTFQFTNFVTWKTVHKTGPFVIGVQSAKAYLPLKSFFSGKTVNDRKVQVVSTDITTALKQQMDIMLYLDADLEELKNATSRTTCNGTLVLTNELDALKSGSHINFIVQSGKVRFEISQAAAKICGMKINARLLKAAMHVE